MKGNLDLTKKNTPVTFIIGLGCSNREYLRVPTELSNRDKQLRLLSRVPDNTCSLDESHTYFPHKRPIHTLHNSDSKNSKLEFVNP